jgi:5-methylcytosine-specific restriction endonuclease McrA
MEYPSTRKQAKITGAKYYFTGEPCKHGHIALRKTKGTCTECLKIEWAKENQRRSTLPKTEAAKEAGKRYYERNRAEVIARAQSRPAEAKRAYKQLYKENNPDLYKALTSFRRKRNQQATPKWLTYTQKKEIRNLYVIAQTTSKITGVRYVVDHIIPINGDNVCGLHVPWNLRVITQEENLIKSNKHES